MKKILFLVVLLALGFVACDPDKVVSNNPNLPNYNFSIDLDFGLPLYQSLLYPSSPVPVNQAGIGINGIVVMNTGSGFVAYEATCPNQPISSCSGMTLNGTSLKCNCDDVVYNLFSGQAQGMQYPLKSYRVQVISSTLIRVYN